MKITFITTVKNEEETIQGFLESLKNQSRKPDEIIVVDGGSTDDTVQNLKVKSQKLNLKVKILKKSGNRSVGRNEAVKNSSHEIIVCADAGCILDRNWLEKITKPFEDKDIDVVAGFYKPLTNSVFEKCLSTYTCVMPDKLDKKNFLPSSRSIAFTKTAWRKAGGYPEELDTCEDLVFDKRLKKSGALFTTRADAIVYWPQRKNLIEAAKQFYSYAVGDGEARYFRRTMPFLFARYILGISLFTYAILTQNYILLSTCYLLLFLYLAWAVWKNYRYVKHPLAFLYLPLLQLTSDMATIGGNVVGFLS